MAIYMQSKYPCDFDINLYMFTYIKLKILEFSNGDQCESKIKTAFLQVSDLVMCLLFVHTIYMRDFAPVCVWATIVYYV